MSESYDELDFDQASDLVKGRQRFRRRPKTSSKLIANLMARKGYGQQKSADQLSEAWSAVAGETWRNQTRVGLIRRGVLEVVVGSSVLNQRLEFEKKKLLGKLKVQLPKTNITDIRFRIGNV